MFYTEEDAIQYINENDVRFIKLFFTDFYGAIKAISIQPTELQRAFSEGIPFDASYVKGFMNESKSDLYIVPDASTLCVLPWRPQQGRVVRFFCSIRYGDGKPFETDARKLLDDFEQKAKEKGYEFKIGTESEFYLFKNDEKGDPTHEPHDNAGYFDLAPRDRGENVRREICLTLEQMGVHPESSHHEAGPGQNEVDFCRSDALNAADNLQTFKIVVKTIASRNGLYASFMPKPIEDKPGNGLHINISLYKNGKNLFASEKMCSEAGAFVAGILNRISEMTPFLNPFPNSYKRLNDASSPKKISWSYENSTQLIRIPTFKNEDTGIDVRSPDSSGNPYLAIYMILAAGFEGIEKNLSLPDSKTDCEILPLSIEEAIKCAGKGDFAKKFLPKQAIDFFESPDNLVCDPAFGEA